MTMEAAQTYRLMTEAETGPEEIPAAEMYRLIPAEVQMYRLMTEAETGPEETPAEEIPEAETPEAETGPETPVEEIPVEEIPAVETGPEIPEAVMTGPAEKFPTMKAEVFQQKY